MKGLNRKGGAFLLPFVIGGGLPGVGIGVIWIPHYPAAAPTRVVACPSSCDDDDDELSIITISQPTTHGEKYVTR